MFENKAHIYYVSYRYKDGAGSTVVSIPRKAPDNDYAALIRWHQYLSELMRVHAGCDAVIINYIYHGTSE